MPGERLNLKLKRVAKGWTQKELGDAAGLSAGTVCRIERGHPCTSSALERLAAALGCPLSEVV